MSTLKAIAGGKSDDAEFEDWAPDAPIDMDRVRTIDLPAERAVLSGAILGLSSEVRPWLLPEHFSSEAHRRIFEAICSLADRGDAISTVTVASELRATDRLAQVGGSPYLTSTVTSAPAIAPAHMQRYARTVRDLAVRRQLGALALGMKASVDAQNATVDSLIDGARAQLDQLSATLAQNEVSIRADAVMARVWTELTTTTDSPEVIGRATGFDRLDRILTGLPKDLVVLAALPGMGKTSLASAIGVNVAKHGGAVYLASLETTELPLGARLICAEGNVDVQRTLLKTLSPSELGRLITAANTIAALPLWTDTESTMGVGDLWQKCRRLQLQLAREGRSLELVIVDYVQLLREPRNARARHEAVATNVRALQKMAHQLGCTVLGLSQVNGRNEDRKDPRPQLRDLAESTELRKCARTILTLFREDFHNPDKSPGIAEVAVLKQSNGPQGCALLRFDAHSTRFSNLEEGT